MSDATSGKTRLTAPRRVYMNQTSGVVYEQPNTNAETVVRVNKGTLLDILPAELPDAGWWPVRTHTGKEGYLKSATKTITREELDRERLHLKSGWRIGWIKIGIGSAVLLGFAVICLLFYLGAKNSDGYSGGSDTILIPTHPQVLFWPLAVGGGNLLWGLEQIFSVRHALKTFDALWKEALR